MPSGPFCLYEPTLDTMLRGSLPSLDASPVSAVLLASTYVPDFKAHSLFSQVRDHEFIASSQVRLLISGKQVVNAAFHSDDLVFGDPVTLGPVRYVVFVFGASKALKADSPLLGLIDLSPAGGAVEAQRDRFAVAVPEAGWFQLVCAV